MEKRNWFYIFATFFAITAFQNCSLYKSSGREFVENGSAKQAKDAQPKPSAAQADSCDPYISNSAASSAMTVASTGKLVFDETSQTVSCVVSAESVSENQAIDLAVCSISAGNLALLQNAPDQTMVLDPYGPLSRGSFGYSRQLANGATQFVFVGSSDSALEAVACQFTFDSKEEFVSSSDEVIDRAARLVHAIHPNLR